MDSHFFLNNKIKVESNFSLICMLLKFIINKPFLIKLKPEDIVIDFGHRVQKKKEHYKSLLKKLK